MTVLGLMSGTSADGIDAAIIHTDGRRVLGFGERRTFVLDDSLRQRIIAAMAQLAALSTDDVRAADLGALERAITDAHIAAVRGLIGDSGAAPGLIGFHGQTLLHRPGDGFTLQLGDGGRLAVETGIDVVADFRRADIAAGGQGAPLAPLYHRALLASPMAATGASSDWPLAILNIGGIANVTWVDDPASGEASDLLAFDTGPGNGLLDRWVAGHTGETFDRDGALAAGGKVDAAVLGTLLDQDYFDAAPPKSLDRMDFSLAPLAGLGTADGAATLTAFTARAVARALAFLPRPPVAWYVCGGGRHNASLMAMLADCLAVPVLAVETLGWNGDALEAEAFAFLAVRSLRRLPVSLPATTGVSRPTTGGRLYRAGRSAGSLSRR